MGEIEEPKKRFGTTSESYNNLDFFKSKRSSRKISIASSRSIRKWFITVMLVASP